MTRAAVDLVRLAIQPTKGQAWHGGPTPVGALRGVSAAQAHWIPAPGRSSIWRLTLHIAYWKYTIRRHLVTTPIPRFPRSPANFPAVPVRADEKLWQADRALLAQEHQLLNEAIAAFTPSRLGRIPVAGKKWTFGEMLIGVALHDAYHVGQIQMIKRMWSSRR